MEEGKRKKELEDRVYLPSWYRYFLESRLLRKELNSETKS